MNYKKAPHTKSLSNCASLLTAGCGSDETVTNPSRAIRRGDDAVQLKINLSGSLQNPAFSPDGNAVVFTRFRDSYNQGASDLFIYNLKTGKLSELVSDGYSHVNLPGSVWNESTGLIEFSCEKETHDELFVIPATGTTGDEVQITNQQNRQSFEPSFSPDGKWIVFESSATDPDESNRTSLWVLDLKNPGNLD